jgi:hypothetical protein
MTDEPVTADRDRTMIRPDLPRTPCDRCGSSTVIVRTGRPDVSVRLDAEPHRLGRYIVVEPVRDADAPASLSDLGPVAVQVPADTAAAIRAYVPPTGAAPTPLYMGHDVTCPYGAPRLSPAGQLAAAAVASCPPEPGLFDVSTPTRHNVSTSTRVHVDTSRRDDVETS